MTLNISSQKPATGVAAKIAVAAQQRSFTPEDLQKLVQDLDGGGLLPSADKTVKRALLEAASLLLALQQQPHNAALGAVEHKTAGASKGAQAASSAAETLRLSHEGRVDTLVAKFDDVAASVEVKTLARFVQASLNSGANALPASEAHALVLFHYSPTKAPTATWTPADLQKASSRAPEARTVLLTVQGLREIGGGSSLGETRPVNAKAMAGAGVSLETLTTRLQQLTSDVASGSVTPTRVQLSTSDRLHTEGLSTQIDREAIYSSFDESMKQYAPERGASILKLLSANLPKMSPAELIDVGAELLQRLSFSTRIDYSYSGNSNLRVASGDMLEVARQIVLATQARAGAFAGDDLAPLKAGITRLAKSPIPDSHVGNEPDGEMVKRFAGDAELWASLAKMTIPTKGAAGDAARLLGWI